MGRDNPMTGAQRSCLEDLCKRAEKPFPEKELTKIEAVRIIDRLTEETGIGTETG
jgi:Protein of unknown function (DUF3072)